MNNESKTLVLLKYEIPTDRNSWFRLRNTYPSTVKDNLGKRWKKMMEPLGEAWKMPDGADWELYFVWLIEELCEYETTHAG